jgi:hypothetical protein
MRSNGSHSQQNKDLKHSALVDYNIKRLDGMLDAEKFGRPYDLPGNRRDRSYGHADPDTYEHVIQGLDPKRLSEDEMQILKNTLGRKRRQNHDAPARSRQDHTRHEHGSHEDESWWVEFPVREGTTNDPFDD